MARIRDNPDRRYYGSVAHLTIHCLLLLAIIVSLRNMSPSKSPSTSKDSSSLNKTSQTLRTNTRATIVGTPILRLPDGSNHVLQVHNINGRNAILISPHLPQPNDSKPSNMHDKRKDLHGNSSPTIMLSPKRKMESSSSQQLSKEYPNGLQPNGDQSDPNRGSVGTTTQPNNVNGSTSTRHRKDSNAINDSLYGTIHFKAVNTNGDRSNNSDTRQERELNKSTAAAAVADLDPYRNYLLLSVVIVGSVGFGALLGKKAVEMAYQWEQQKQEDMLAYDIAYTTTTTTNDLLGYGPDSIMFGSTMPPLIWEGNNLDKFDI